MAERIESSAMMMIERLSLAWNAPEIVIEYLKTGDRKLRAEAQEAAQEARDTAWAATQDDRHAVWAAREKQNKQLTKMVNDILRR